MQIWRIGNRLFMIMDVDDGYSPERAARLERENPTVVRWEKDMWHYQLPTPWTPHDAKWAAMELLFDLGDRGNQGDQRERGDQNNTEADA